MTKRALFLVNGLGLGNSTRCYAIIQQLAQMGVAIEVVTSGNGCWFFADKPEIGRITEIPALQYGKKDGRISVAATLGMIGQMVSKLRAADAIVGQAIARFQPDVVVADSSYSFRSVRRAGLPFAALNNSDMVMRGIRQFRDRPASILPQFMFVEFFDYLYHSFIPDLVISPRLDPNDHGQSGTFRFVGPIVREDCAATELSTQTPKSAVIMLSGSAFGSQVHLTRQFAGINIEVIGREGELPGVTFHGKVRDSLPLLRRADLVMVNGGFSAVSEALMLRKPMIVIPVPRHSEQWVNGRTVEELGVGISAAEDRLEEALADGLAHIENFRAAYRRLSAIENGSIAAAKFIVGLIGQPRR